MRPIGRRTSSGTRTREPMSQVPPGVISEYGLVAPSGATTRTATSEAMPSRSRVTPRSYPLKPLKNPSARRTRSAAQQDLARLKAHHAASTGGGRLRAAIFGINDGLVTNASLVVGVAAADPGRQVVILAGLPGWWLAPSAWPRASTSA